MINDKLFSERLKSLVERTGKSQKQVSEELGFSRGRLSEIIRIGSTSLFAADVIADHFDVPLDWLLGRGCKPDEGTDTNLQV